MRSALSRSRRWSAWRLAATLFLGTGCSQRAAEAPPAAAGAVAPAMRVYRDPNTGAFGEPPPGTTPAAPAAPGALSEEAAPGGGRMIRLRGAFRSQMVGRTEANATTISCSDTGTACAPGETTSPPPKSATP